MPVPVGISPGRNDPRSPYYEEPEPEPDPDHEYEKRKEQRIEERIEAEAEHVTED